MLFAGALAHYGVSLSITTQYIIQWNLSNQDNLYIKDTLNFRPKCPWFTTPEIRRPPYLGHFCFVPTVSGLERFHCIYLYSDYNVITLPCLHTVDAAYELLHKRTVLASGILIALHLPFLVGILVLYHRLVPTHSLYRAGDRGKEEEEEGEGGLSEVSSDDDHSDSADTADENKQLVPK